jgi:cytochrome P450
MLGPYPIKQNSDVIINVEHIGKNEKYFPDPLAFDPQRWLTGNIEDLKNYDITRNFGGGLRVCIGKRFAEEESVLLLALIISQFEISLEGIGDVPVDGKNENSKIQLVDIPTVTNVTMTFEKSVSIKFTPIAKTAIDKM